MFFRIYTYTFAVMVMNGEHNTEEVLLKTNVYSGKTLSSLISYSPPMNGDARVGNIDTI